MKIDRMFGILAILLQHDMVKARDLAERFEVSVRTIYRDLDAIAGAGIPVCAIPGAGGGVGLMPGFKLDRSLLSADDLSSIVAGLKGLATAEPERRLDTLLAKLLPGGEGMLPLEHDILIDLSSWDSHHRTPARIADLRRGIAGRLPVEMEYYSANGYSRRVVEPARLIFKDTAWYLYAYCRMRGDWRMFRLNRIAAYRLLDEPFAVRPVVPPVLRWDTFDPAAPPGEDAVLRFEAADRFLVMDLLGVEALEPEPDGSLLVRIPGPDDGWLLRFVLGFGDRVTVLAPDWLRLRVREAAEKLLAHYNA